MEDISPIERLKVCTNRVQHLKLAILERDLTLAIILHDLINKDMEKIAVKEEYGFMIISLLKDYKSAMELFKSHS